MAYVRAKTSFRYRGARVQPSDVIEVPDKDVRLLVAIGRAEEAEKPRGRGRPPKPKDEKGENADRRAIDTPAAEPKAERAAEPESTVAREDDEKAKPPKRSYNRRDLTADE